MGVEVAKEVPETIAGGLHSNSGRLAGVDGHSANVLVVLPNVVSVPVQDMSVETHVPDVPNGVLVLAHLKWWTVSVDVAV